MATAPDTRPDKAFMQADTGYFTRRWRHQVPATRLLVLDLLAVGTVCNLLASFAGLMAVAMGASSAWGLGLHLAPTPYNVFLCAAVWRHPQARAWHRAPALLWLVLMLLV